MDSAYDFVNKSWKSTCRVLLKDEVGDLKDLRIIFCATTTH
ncbi:MAG: hypothetical protein ABIF01_04875 [Candidatus Micrarchaeota archaeon]